jgi:hypothetical protein
MDWDIDWEPIIWGLVIGLPLLGAGVFVIRRYWNPKEETPLHFRCPGCKTKLRYYRRQAGHRGMCMNCREKFVFPAPPVGAAR